VTYLVVPVVTVVIFFAMTGEDKYTDEENEDRTLMPFFIVNVLLSVSYPICFFRRHGLFTWKFKPTDNYYRWISLLNGHDLE
jgi:hypothetical protein